MLKHPVIPHIARVALIMVLLLGLFCVKPAHALGVIVVNSNTDTSANDGKCTLREAIISANGDAASGPSWGECSAGSGTDLIRFHSSLSGATITLGSSLPAFSADAFVDGSALASRVTIDGANSYQIFQVNSGVNVYLDSLVITHGLAAGSGGGIFNDGGTLTVIDSTFNSNVASGSGGAIAITSGGTGVITNSTFSGNSAFSNGGAILNMSTLVVTNSTFSGNTVYYYGGGIANLTGSILTITNSTLSGNLAGSGGGIYNLYNTFNYSNTIIADSVSDVDCYSGGATIGTNTNNLVEDGSCSASFSGDPKLAPLGNYGGLTQTMALRSGSPAIDAGDDGSCPASDQRGITRPQGGHCDIGAFEDEGLSMMSFTSEAANDGWILEYSENNNSGGTKNNTDATLRVGDDAQDRQYKSILSFNTSALPDTASVKRVLVFFEQSSITGTNPFGTHGMFFADIRKPNFGMGAALGLDDFKALPSKPQACTFGLDSTPNWYGGTCLSVAFPFVNLTGKTQFRLYFSLDDNDNLTADILNLFSGNAANAADRPYIEVYYTP